MLVAVVRAFLPRLAQLLLFGNLLSAQLADPQTPAQVTIRQIQAGDFLNAGRSLRAAVRQHPKDPELWNLLGITESELHHTASAREAFERGLGLTPSSTSLNENLGLLFYKTADYVHAKQSLARAVALGSKKPGVLFSLAASRLRTGEPAQALAELKSLEPALSSTPDYWEERARAELPRDAASAERCFDRALALSPASSTAFNGAAAAAEKQGLDEKALAYLIKARAAAPDDVPTLLHFANVCIRRDLGPDAITALERARRLEPSNASVLYLLARANISVENWRKAYDLFNDFTRYHPNFAPTYYALGWIDVRLNRVDDARRQLEHCLRLEPDLVDARYQLAQLNYDDGQIDVARALLAAVLRKNPHHARANMTMGDILMREGDLARAQGFLESATREDPKLAAAHYKLGALYTREHQPEKAAAEGKIAAALNSEAARASKTQLRLVLPENIDSGTG